MSAPVPGPFLTLGLFPTSRGFGWAAFDGPFSLVDHGLFTVHKDKNAACLARIEELLNKLPVEDLILESFDARSTLRSHRIQQLCHNIIAIAEARNITQTIYTRADVQQCFAGVGAMTRDQIASAVARHVTPLRSRLPERRNPWESEDKRMAIFNAAALVLTHFHFGTNRLFADLSGS